MAMRFLHTSDWHVGKALRHQKRESEYVSALGEVLDIAIHEKVDCLLVAGDVFESAVPTPDAERIVYHFFSELRGAGIPAVVVAGNHDHPRRMNAFAPLLELLDIHVRADTVLPSEGGIIELRAKRSDEVAQIAVLPWVSERKAREFASLMKSGDESYREYAEDVARRIGELASHYRPDTVHILVAHVMMDGAIVGRDGGERPLHITDVYAVKPQRLPRNAQYIALGHLHRPQPIIDGRAYYSGSLLQLDFGEAGTEKSVRLIDATPGRPAETTEIPLKSIRQLRNVPDDKHGLTLDEVRALADEMGDAYLKVFVKVDRPFPGLADQVRELLPNALDIVVERTDAEQPDAHARLEGMSPGELFTAYYERQHTSQPAPELTALFNRLLEEATSAAD